MFELFYLMQLHSVGLTAPNFYLEMAGTIVLRIMIVWIAFGSSPLCERGRVAVAAPLP